MTPRRWLTSLAPPGAASASGSTTTTAVSATISPAAARAAQMQSLTQPLAHRPGGEHQDRGPQQRREERIQHQHAANADPAQQQCHQHAFRGHALVMIPPAGGL